MSKLSIFGYGPKQRFQTVGITLLVALIGLILGLFLDSQFGTKPLFSIVLVVLSYPFCQYFLYKKFINLPPKNEVEKQNS